MELGTQSINLPPKDIPENVVTNHIIADIPESVVFINNVMENARPENLENFAQNGVQDVSMEEGHSASHGVMPKSGQFLPVEGGYIFVDGDIAPGMYNVYSNN